MELESLDPRERLELLSAYLDGELPADEAREVTAWLDRHPDALREVERQRRLWDLLGRYPDEPVPAGFSRRVLAEARGGEAPRAAAPHVRGGLRLLPRRAWAVAAAALVLAAVGLGVTALRTKDEPEGRKDVLAAIDADFVQHADLERLVLLSDAQFEALLVEDPDALADASLGGGTLGG
jgi:anti-sigma factor RsiW